MAEQHFFQSFFGPQEAQIQQQIPEYVTHNETVMEIVNNWMHVKDLINRYKAGKLQQVDQLEHTWYIFIVGKNIDISQYKNKEEFIQAFWRNP